MADELSRAISFANGYFVLADGLVADLVDHLAEDVVLDWFGQTIEGRVNVAAFMKDEKISSRHIFNEVNPVTTIGYRKQRPLRRKYYSIGGTHENGNLITIRNENDDDEGDDDNHDDDNSRTKYKRQCFSDGILIKDGNSKVDESSDNFHGMEVEYDDESECDNTSLKMHDEMNKRNSFDTANIMECNLNFDKLKLDGDKVSTPNTTIVKRDFLDSDEVNYALHELGNKLKLKTGFKPTDVNEIEKKIIQLKERKIVMPPGFIKAELGQGDGPSVHGGMNAIKYIEACGVIEFSRFFNTKQIRKDIRKRSCRLQIAYSVKDKDSNITIDGKNSQSMPINSIKIDQSKIGIMKKSSKLKSLRELRQLSDNLIPHADDKIDFSTDDDDIYDDVSNERNKFLKCLKLKPMNNNDNENMNDLVTPKYVRHHLTFDNSPKRLLAGTGDTRGFVFNYNIHLIIYESNTKCRLNLSHEFENKDLSDN